MTIVVVSFLLFIVMSVYGERWATAELIREEQDITPYKVESKAGFAGKHSKYVRGVIENELEGREPLA